MASDSDTFFSKSSRINAEVYGIRAKHYLRAGIRLLAVLLILYAAWNMFAPFIGYNALRVYPEIQPVQATQYRIVFLGDAVAILVGAIVGYVV